jgi:hypothetical protein
MAPGRPLVEKVISLHVWLPNTLGSGSPTLVRATPGDVAQLVERLLCKQEVAGSSPAISTARFLVSGGLPYTILSMSASISVGSSDRPQTSVILPSLTWKMFPHRQLTFPP